MIFWWGSRRFIPSVLGWITGQRRLGLGLGGLPGMGGVGGLKGGPDMAEFEQLMGGQNGSGLKG